MSAKALFIDLDGTLIETKSGDTFPKDKDDWKFKAGMLGKLVQFHIKGYKLVIISNQAGIDKGYVNAFEFSEKINTIHNNLTTFLHLNRYLPDWPQFNAEFCISTYEEHPWRKPNPDAAYFVADKFNLDLSKSIMVGDASGIWRRKVGVPDYIVEEFENYVDKGLDIKVIDTNDGTRYEKAVDGAVTTYYTTKKDFSDSDKQFAQNAGIGTYYDVEEFVKLDVNELR